MTCERCGKPLPPIAVREGDPYCSTVCAKTAHGVSPVGSGFGPQGRPPKLAKTKAA